MCQRVRPLHNVVTHVCACCKRYATPTPARAMPRRCDIGIGEEYERSLLSLLPFLLFFLFFFLIDRPPPPQKTRTHTRAHARTHTHMDAAHICTCTHTHALINHRCRRMCSVNLCQAGDHAMPWARSRQKPLETAAVGYFRLPLGKHTARETRAIQQHSQAVLKCLWDHPNWPDPSTSFLWGSVLLFLKEDIV